jgi:hypothetical protein
LKASSGRRDDIVGGARRAAPVPSMAKARWRSTAPACRSVRSGRASCGVEVLLYFKEPTAAALWKDEFDAARVIDAFNLDKTGFPTSARTISVMLLLIENYRSGLIWKMFPKAAWFGMRSSELAIPRLWMKQRTNEQRR